MRKDLLIRYLNSSSSALVKAQNLIRNGLQAGESNASTTTRDKIVTSGYSAQDLTVYKTLLENTANNWETLNKLLRHIEENLESEQ